MRFGQTLKASVYAPWKDEYLDYAKLKSMLREDRSQDDSRPWTEDDETRFCEELLNVQLEKVAAFQESTFQKLEQRASQEGEKLRDLAPEEGKPKGDITTGRFKEVEGKLDKITNEVNELKKYSSLNYTGFLKIAKKHDRKRGNRYKVRPMLQISLSKRPFNSEQGYSPLLNKLSMMYFILRQNLETQSDKRASYATDKRASSLPEAQSISLNGEVYAAYKFWIHPDNLLEVKTYILRRLPMLVYSQVSEKQVDASQEDPTITSVYFDDSNFSLYSQKVDRLVDATSLRLKWYGKLNGNEIYLEKKIVHEDGINEEERFSIKEKYIEAFLKGQYQMEKTIHKLERQGQPEGKVAEYKGTVADIQHFIQEKQLQPVLRANYTRTAFQRPLDDRVRISIDTKLAFIREDSLDPDRPCRNPEDWHRSDIDNGRMDYPFSSINQGEISRFPFAVLEIKVKEDLGKKTPQWVEDLMSSHLVHKAPRFSKFVHGIATLFDDHVNNLPFWLSEVETDIRKDPHTAFVEEEQAKALRAEEEQLVGSYMGGASRRASYKPALSSPLSKSYLSERMAAENRKSQAISDTTGPDKGKGRDVDDGESDEGAGQPSGYGTLTSIFPTFSVSRYAQSRRRQSVKLPPGVTKPGQLIKDSGPLQVEPKVWLANERTFLKWQHICILLGALAVSLYTAAGEDIIAEAMGIVYILIAAFAGLWGYYMHFTRRNMIVARSGKDFDNLLGPMVVSAALIVALLLNFFFKYRVAVERFNQGSLNATQVVHLTVEKPWARFAT